MKQKRSTLKTLLGLLGLVVLFYIAEQVYNPTIKPSEITQEQADRFIETLYNVDESSMKDIGDDAVPLYEHIEYTGDGNIDINVSFIWFLGDPRLVGKNLGYTWDHWSEVSNCDEVTLTIIYKEYKILKVFRDDIRRLMTQEDSDKVQALVEEELMARMMEDFNKEFGNPEDDSPPYIPEIPNFNRKRDGIEI